MTFGVTFACFAYNIIAVKSAYNIARQVRDVNRLRLFVGKISAKLGIPEEIATNTPKVTMLGVNKLTVENHKGLVEYSADTVRIKTSFGIICIDGSDLLLDVMDSCSVAVSGKIYHIMTAK